MQRALLIRLRPLGPWRYGPADGAHDRVDTLYRSDRLYSAITLAMDQLGHLEEWLEATARAKEPVVVFTSLFPFQAETLFAPPPTTLWPPPAGLVTTASPVFLTKVRWRAARLVPLDLLQSLLNGQPILADQWSPDAESGCLLRRDRPSSSPFRAVQRSVAAVDRITGCSVHPDTTACVEFEPGSGLWTLARFSSEAAESSWSDRLKSAFRLLSDTGFGGRRSSGWGQTAAPEFQSGAWPHVLMPKLKQGVHPTAGHDSSLYWLLSLYSPSSSDSIDWTGGFYELTVRGGRVESRSQSGALKKQVRMVLEGSVMSAAVEPVGAAVDVSPVGFAHPVYRSGLALALRLPTVVVSSAQAEPEASPSPEPAVSETESTKVVLEPVSPEASISEAALPEVVSPEESPTPVSPEAVEPDRELEVVLPEETPMEPILSIDEQQFDFAPEEPAGESIPEAGSDPQPFAEPDPLAETTPDGDGDSQPAAVPDDESHEI